jgi:hypothetical protein
VSESTRSWTNAKPANIPEKKRQLAIQIWIRFSLKSIAELLPLQTSGTQRARALQNTAANNPPATPLITGLVNSKSILSP